MPPVAGMVAEAPRCRSFDSVSERNAVGNTADHISGRNARFCITPCPSCTRPATRFYCSDCVTHGYFTASCSSGGFLESAVLQSTPTFAELRLKLYEHKLEADNAVERLLRTPVRMLSPSKIADQSSLTLNKRKPVPKPPVLLASKNAANPKTCQPLLQYTQLTGQCSVIRNNLTEKHANMVRHQAVLHAYQQQVIELRRSISSLREENEGIVKQQCAQQIIRLRQLTNRKVELASRRDAVCLQLARRQKALVVDLVTSVFCVEPAVSSAWSTPSRDLLSAQNQRRTSELNAFDDVSHVSTSPKRLSFCPQASYFIDRYPMSNLTRIVYAVVPTQSSWIKFWLDFEESKRMSLLISSTRDFASSTISVHSLSSKERLLDGAFTTADGGGDDGSGSSSSDSGSEGRSPDTRRPRRRHTMGSQQQRPQQRYSSTLRAPRSLMPAISVLSNPVPAALFYLCHLNRCLRNVLFLCLPGFLFSPYEVARTAADVEFASNANTTNVHGSKSSVNADGLVACTNNGGGGILSGTGSNKNAQRIARLCADVGNALLAICITQGCGTPHLENRPGCDARKDTTTTWFVDENGERFDVDRAVLTGYLLSLVSHAGTGRCRPYSLEPLSSHHISCDNDDFNDNTASSFGQQHFDTSARDGEFATTVLRSTAFSPARKRSSHRLRQVSGVAALSEQRENRLDDEASDVDGWEKISDDGNNTATSPVVPSSRSSARTTKALGLPVPESMRPLSQAMNRSISTGSGFMTVMSSLWKSSAPDQNTK